MRRMREMTKRRAVRCFLAATLAAGLSVSAGNSALAEDARAEPGATGPDLTAKIVDATLLRPLGLLSTVAGAGFFVVSLPITIAAEQVGTAREVLVETPYENTFERPLGRI
ncbi:MAG: hypothetical protein OSB70_00210 [Myxococcota bacterium]|nr:hypothetical protein [Myxococcota bacterium]